MKTFDEPHEFVEKVWTVEEQQAFSTKNEIQDDTDDFEDEYDDEQDECALEYAHIAELNNYDVSPMAYESLKKPREFNKNEKGFSFTNYLKELSAYVAENTSSCDETAFNEIIEIQGTRVINADFGVKKAFYASTLHRYSDWRVYAADDSHNSIDIIEYEKKFGQHEGFVYMLGSKLQGDTLKPNLYLMTIADFNSACLWNNDETV